LATLGAVAAIILGNALRAAALFYPEAHIVQSFPSWGHAGVGVLVFLAVAAGIAWFSYRLAPKVPPAEVENLLLPSRTWLVILLPVTLAAALVPLWHPTPAVRPADHFPGWPASFEGYALRELPLSARERKFMEGFPGRTGRFTDGNREFVIRWVTHETRLLHPAADCFTVHLLIFFCFEFDF
jgi:hypothetical protein